MTTLSAHADDRLGALAANGLRALLLLALLIPLVYTADTLYPFNIGKSLYARALISAVFPLYLILAIRKPEFRPRPTAVAACTLLVIAVTVVAGLLGDSPTVSFWSTYSRSQGIVETLHLLALSFMLAAMFRPQHWRTVLISGAVSVNALVVVAGIMAFHDIIDMPYLDHARRLYSTLGQPMFLAAHCTTAAVLICMLWSRLPRWRTASWQGALAAGLLLLLALNGWAIYLSSGRLAVVTLIAVIAFAAGALLVLSPRPGVRMAAAAVLAALALFVAAILALVFTDHFNKDKGFETLVNRTSRTLQARDNSAVGRISALTNGYRAFLDRPFLGWGPELFDRGWVRHVTEEEHNGRIFDQAHNKVMEVAVTTGTVGLAAYGLLTVAIVVAFGRMVLLARRANLAHAVFTSALFVNYASLAMFLFDTTSFLYIFALMLAFAMLAEQDHPFLWPSIAGRLPLRMPPLPAVPARILNAALAAVLIAAVAAGATYSQLLNFDFHRGAQDHRITGDFNEVMTGYTATVHAFPPMATSRRIDYTLAIYRRIHDLTEDEKRAVMPFLVRQLELALAHDPTNWKIHYVSAALYTAAAGERADFPDLARWHLTRLRELSPHSHYTVEIANLLDFFLR